MPITITPRIFRGIAKKRFKSECKVLKARIKLSKFKAKYECEAFYFTEI